MYIIIIFFSNVLFLSGLIQNTVSVKFATISTIAGSY